MTLSWRQEQSAATRLVDAIRWLPALAGAAYVATVAALSPELVRALDWDTDASGPLALAERLRGSGPVYLPHFGAWTTYWWLLATRAIPGHETIWEATGYVFAIAAAVLVGWATARVAGRWAGVTAGAAALVVGPFALRGLMSVIFHVTNPFSAAVLAAYLVLLPRSRSSLLVVAVGLLTGANAASDPLLWFAGVAPFAVAAVVLARLLRSKEVATRAGAVVALAVSSAIATNLVMHRLGYHVVGLERALAPVGAFRGNAVHLARMLALLGGANYAYPPAYPREPLRTVVAVAVLAAIAAPVLAAIRLWLRRVDPTLRAFACYWACATLLLCIVLVVTPNAKALGFNSVYYVLTLALAAGAGVALLAAGSPRAQLVVATGVVLVGATNVAGLVAGRVSASPPLAAYKQPLVRLLDQAHVRRGYAGYWDAQNLSWQSGMHLLVAPVTRCTKTDLCAYNFFTVESWYDPRPGPSFLLLDDTNRFVAGAPPFVSTARRVLRLGPLTLYLFDYDIARHIRHHGGAG